MLQLFLFFRENSSYYRFPAVNAENTTWFLSKPGQGTTESHYWSFPQKNKNFWSSAFFFSGRWFCSSKPSDF
jgi:hypothetical protein